MNRACFPKEKTPEFTKMGEIHELFVFALSLVWFAGATLCHHDYGCLSLSGLPSDLLVAISVSGERGFGKGGLSTNGPSSRDSGA